MGFEEFGEALKEFNEEYFVIDDEDYFLVYRKLANGPEFVGSVSFYDAEVYEFEDILRYLGLY